MFSDNWLNNLLACHDGTNIPTSRLIESGKMPSGTHGLSLNCGKDVKNLNKVFWSQAVNMLSEDVVRPKGLYMPCVFEKNRFVESGMFPEGNIYRDGIGTCNGPAIQSGDDWYFRKLEKDFNMKHITVFNSLVYHIQEGEKDEHE
jgi:hypothetical protein